ncbi:hypothetical protein SLS56_010197 [Neofusicoccum ribis]|uniref:Aflatoxin biosynthesis ketoreductase nor-1 n=1 Tax=Neofusicoccum ribis TaxID=45134 RepID=A0ABR3SFA9_9PEZI
MSGNTIVLITGASRGIGEALVSTYLSQPSTTVIAGVRDPSRSQSLSALPTGPASTLLTVQLDVASDASVAAAFKQLADMHAVPHLDIVVSNAGVNAAHGPLSSASVAALAEHVDVNAYGALRLFQHALSLLQRSARTSRFAVVSSPVGSFALVERMAKLPMGVYGASKALANFLVKKLAVEEEGVVSWCIHPG